MALEQLVDAFPASCRARGLSSKTIREYRYPLVSVFLLSRDEIQALEDVAVTERDKLIVRILGDTGIRVGELVNRTTSDLINRDRNLYLRVGGKTGERIKRRPGGDHGPSRRLESSSCSKTSASEQASPSGSIPICYDTPTRPGRSAEG